MTGTHRCAKPSCPFNAPEGEDYCDLCRTFEQVFDNTDKLRHSRKVIILAFEKDPS